MQYTLYVIVRCFDSCHRPVGKQRHRDLCETPSSHGFNQPSWPWKAVDCHTLLIAARAEVDHLKRRLSQVNLMWLGWFPWFPWVFSLASAVPDGRNMRPVDVMHRVSGKKLVLLEPRNVKHMVAQARVQLTLFFLRNYCGRVYLLNSDDIPEHIGDFLELWSALGLLLRIQTNTVQKKKTNAKKHITVWRKTQTKAKQKTKRLFWRPKTTKEKKQNKTKQNKSRIHLHVVAFVFFFSRSFSFAGDLRKKHNKREKRANKKRQEGNTCKKRANKQQPHINVLYTGFSFGFVFMLLCFCVCVLFGIFLCCSDCFLF